jgi:hypothetical protein
VGDLTPPPGWSAFAHSGDPNNAGAPRWNRFQPAIGAVQSLTPEVDSPRRPKDQAPEASTVDLGAEHRCGFWSTID